MEKSTARAPARRLPGLDLIRAAAIAWVMIYHGSLFDLTSQDHWLVRFGWMGVDLFFVLSGFLIAGQLLRPWARGVAPSYSRFFARRLLRTLPAYLVVVAVYFLIPGVRDRADIAPLWQFLTFSENWLVDMSTPKAFSHVWSLCVEEQFYLIFPAVVALIALRPTPAKVVGALAFVVVLGMALRGYLWLHAVGATPFDIAAAPRSGAYMRLIYYPTGTRLDGLLMGIAAAAIRAFRPAIWNRITARPNLLLAAGLLGVVASTFVFHGQIAGFWPTVLGFPFLSFSIVLIVMAGAENRSLIGRYPVPGAGALAAGAYSLYLSHKAVFHAVQLVAPQLPAPLQGAAFALALLGALAVGAALYWMVERPALKLRDRLEGPSRSSLAVAATLGDTR
ncbi:acyltransferase [Phenylobacterium sp.]|uniref:acyltransferase family protein n=1 Tax=Phenylobacterium sp. TaxID=1871053 RepID=UPI0012113120|nr:acyltransferase [Phenylobacterium sp.]THD50738.1 MAG: acyltransferase [Phenylobacterium sp.]